VPKFNVWVYRITIPLLAISTIAVIIALFLTLWPYKTVEVREPIKITNQPVAAGTVVSYEVEQCRYTDATATVTRRLISKSNRELYIPLGGNTSQAPAGCYTFTPPAVLIPIDTPPGEYTIEFKLEFQVNPIRTITDYVYSQDFTVTESNMQ
jgi:hypothetical protein